MSKQDDGGRIYPEQDWLENGEATQSAPYVVKTYSGITRLNALADRIAAAQGGSLLLPLSGEQRRVIAFESYGLAEAVIAEGRRREREASDAAQS